MVRFVSFEPLLEKIRKRSLRGIDWAIIGGESGPGHREMDPEWVYSLMDQCRDDGVRVFFKQWGGRTPKANGRRVRGRTVGRYPTERAADRRSREAQLANIGVKAPPLSAYRE